MEGVKIGEYDASANSLAAVFLECLDDPAHAALFAEIKHTEAAQALRCAPLRSPHLSEVGRIVNEMWRGVLQFLFSYGNVKLYRPANVRRIVCFEPPDGADAWRFRLDMDPPSEAAAHSVFAKQVFVNCGGRQKAQMALSHLPQDQRIVASDDFLRWPRRDIAAVCNVRAPHFLIVGGAHSALSSLARITQCFGPSTPASATILSPAPFRLFYESPTAALADAYAFDPKLDVCPLTGRVNRFSGLRYESFLLAKAIGASGRAPNSGVTVRICFMRAIDWRELPAGLRSADLIIVASGYEPAFPPFVNRNDAPMALGDAVSTLGNARDGRVRHSDGRVVFGAYAFGLGAGLGYSQRVGGEPRLARGLDGIWLYQHDVGDEVLNSVLADLQTLAPLP